MACLPHSAGSPRKFGRFASALVMGLLCLWLLPVATGVPEAKADVLFLDLNNSPKEIEAAEAAAKKAGRKLEVFPKVDEATRAQIAALQQEQNKLHDYRMANCKKSNSGSKKCQTAENRIQEISGSLKELEKANALDLAEVEAEIAKREREKRPFTTMVISGHDGTGLFNGTFGEVLDSDLSSMMAKYPVQANSLRSLHLWGCYTASPGSLINDWLLNFPNTSLVSGFDDQAPLNDKPAGWKYLSSVIEKEEELLAIADAKKLKELLENLPGADQTHAALFVCGAYASHSETYDLADLKNMCVKWASEAEKLKERYNCYKQAKDPACADPPKKTSEGPVRAYYEAVQKTSACDELELPELDGSLDDRDSALRLIFYKNVSENFARQYSKELAEMDALLEKQGVDPKARFSKLGEMSRKEMMEAMEALGAYIQPKTKVDVSVNGSLKALLPSPPPETSPELKSMIALHRSLARTLVGLSPFCVPFNWIEKNKSEASKCVPQEGFVKEGLRVGPAPQKNRIPIVPGLDLMDD